MNYYDELGLAPDADDGDIRRAHRTLSKVLHPDRQTDPATREAAELQMRRINAIVDTLLDPPRRAEYNAVLREGPLPASVPQPNLRDAQPRRRSADSIGALLLTATTALVLTSAAVWLLYGDLLHFRHERNSQTPSENGAQETPRQPATTSSTRAGESAPVALANHPSREPLRTIARLEKPGKTAVSESEPKDPAAPPPPKRITSRTPLPAIDIPAQPPLQPVRTPPGAAPSIGIPAAPVAAVLSRQEPAPAATMHEATLAGLWLYAPDSSRAIGTKLYAPEYIQLQIRADHEAMSGEYSARYLVPDRPISAEVAFHFQGKADGTLSFAWQSDDGSLGVVDLKMVTPETLRVSWRVSHFGTRLGLGAGTAVLIRKSGP